MKRIVNQIKCYCGHTTYCDCGPLEENKQETLEEVAERLYPGVDRQVDRMLFINGAKYMQEKMYSEEEVITFLQKYRFDLSSGENSNLGDTTPIWFEQFKKK